MIAVRAASIRIKWGGMQEGGLRQTGRAAWLRHERHKAHVGAERSGVKSGCIVKVHVAFAVSRCAVVVHLHQGDGARRAEEAADLWSGGEYNHHLSRLRWERPVGSPGLSPTALIVP